jgi:regulator of sirC expression with transglutaminase-like and TPR domain
MVGRVCPAFAELAAATDPPLDRLALALAAEFRAVDVAGTLAALDALGEELAQVAAGVPDTPEAECAACARVLGRTHGFSGDTEEYDHPDNSMLDLVVARRRGLPILLSIVYVEVARRAGIPLRGVGLPGHFVAGHLGDDPPLLVDPFSGGAFVETDAPAAMRRPWDAHETAMRMLNNLVAAYQRRGDLGRALRAASMRLELPAAPALREELRAELRAMQARLN